MHAMRWCGVRSDPGHGWCYLAALPSGSPRASFSLVPYGFGAKLSAARRATILPIAHCVWVSLVPASWKHNLRSGRKESFCGRD